MTAFSVLRPGMFTTVQDLGRWGFQSRGVPVSGALDWFSHRLANGLVGNDPRAATLEVTLLGPQVRFESPTVFAVAGAEFRLTLDDTPVEMGRVMDARAGSVLRFGERVSGARAYLALTGGVDVPEVLGSRSTHALTGMGGYEGRALRSGDTLALGKKAPGAFLAESPQKGSRSLFPQSRLRVVAADRQLAESLAAQRFQISSRSDRMGYRLEKAKIADAPTGDHISRAVPTGTIQVPPTGEPILLMNDHATTGGYAIAAVVITADLPLAGQFAPCDWVEFELCSIETADQAMRLREAMLGAA
jgi:antagonist of KipI